MPESRESEASYLIAAARGTELIEQEVDLRLEKIEINATEKEEKRFNKAHPAKSGLPYAINSTCTVKRGTNKAQSYIYPEMWHTSGKKKSKHSLTELALESISYTHQALILDMGPLFLMIQWMTHTSAQWYPNPLIRRFVNSALGWCLSSKTMCLYS
ncbi:hypothetical protein DFH07DRAFT_765176 [Mycena maculata]|uniref:Uncharacterized protein n=1 Tax=Mycena maculata TaxID=230809 RepID=A0AAD7K8R4_9AGAR|nr:hypothetical protein DFH07DRAFT_765176 [Mycena maculata]